MWSSWNKAVHDYSPIWKAAIAAMLAWDAARVIGSDHPYFAPIAVILTMQTTVQDSIWGGGQRVIGIVLGIIMAEVSQHVVGIRGWSIGLLVLVGTLVARLLRLGRPVATQICVSALLVWIIGISHSGYAVDRVRDTLVGVITAILCHMLILPPDFTPEARQAIREAAIGLGERFEATGEWIQRGAPTEQLDSVQFDTEAYSIRLHETWKELLQARHALRFNPLVRNRKTRLEGFEQHFSQIRQGYELLYVMFRTVGSWRDSNAWDATAATRWGDTLQSMARCLRTWAEVSLAWEPHGSPNTRVGSPISNSLLSMPLSSHDFEAALQNDAEQFRRLFVVK